MSESVDFIAPEQPGFGETELPDWLIGFDDLVLHYRDLADALGLQRFHLVGLSLGGWIAAELAVFYPERVKSLTLIAPAGLHIRGKPLVDLFAMPPERIAQTLFSGDPTDYLEYLPDGTSLDDIVHAYGEMTTFARFAWAPHHDPKLPRRLRSLHVPALVVGAEDDWVVPNEHVDLWAELLPDARVVRIPSTGHLAIIQDPDRTAEAIVSFVREVSR
jgi:pimeloyl-ACP methyl ester carboxylesterase